MNGAQFSTRRCACCGDPIYPGEDWEHDEDGFACHSDCLDWDGFYDQEYGYD